MPKFWKEAVERAARTFVQAYLSVWLVTGASFDGLADADNWKAGVVAVAMSIAMSLGLKKAGPDKDSASAV